MRPAEALLMLAAVLSFVGMCALGALLTLAWWVPL